jgi:hypothetical protein
VTTDATYFRAGDLVYFGKYKNKLAKIISFGLDLKQNPTVTIEPVPKGRKQPKTMGLFKIWKARPKTAAQRIAERHRAEVQLDPVTVLPNGSAFAVGSFPLPKDHWLTQPGHNEPPMPWRTDDGSPRRKALEEAIRAVGKHALRASTLNGQDMDLDPDALIQNLIIGFLGYYNTPVAVMTASDRTRHEKTQYKIPVRFVKRR